MDTPLKTGEIHPLFCMRNNLFLDYRNPDTFVSVASRCHGVDESMQPDAGVHHHALKLVHPNEDTTLRVVRIIACMDADALEIRHAQQQR